jgi:hypothetical protein
MHGAPPLGALAFSYRKIVPFIQVCQLKRPNVMCRCLVHVCVCARVCVCACVGGWVRGCVYVSVSLPLVSRACSQRLRRYAADASTLVRPSAPTPTKFVIDFSPARMPTKHTPFHLPRRHTHITHEVDLLGLDLEPPAITRRGRPYTYGTLVAVGRCDQSQVITP